jgi:hypothetical protein
MPLRLKRDRGFILTNLTAYATNLSCWNLFHFYKSNEMRIRDGSEQRVQNPEIG